MYPTSSSPGYGAGCGCRVIERTLSQVRPLGFRLLGLDSTICRHSARSSIAAAHTAAMRTCSLQRVLDSIVRYTVPRLKGFAQCKLLTILAAVKGSSAAAYSSDTCHRSIKAPQDDDLADSVHAQSEISTHICYRYVHCAVVDDAHRESSVASHCTHHTFNINNARLLMRSTVQACA